MRAILAGLLLFIAGAVHAAPVTIDFEEYVGDVADFDPVLPNTPLAQGFILDPDPGNLLWLNGSGPSPTSVGLLSDGPGATFTHAGGLAFDLLSIDIAYIQPGLHDFNISATLAGGGTVSSLVTYNFPDIDYQTYTDTALFTGITSLTISPGEQAPFFAMDNITVNVVPIPAAFWLFGSGLVALRWLRRKA
ncbi:MAG: hypothetical protein ACR2P6_00410 [Gammaproteobacteria bacterium]